MNRETPSIQTARLTMRPLQDIDAEVLHHIYQSEGILRYFPNPSPPALGKVQRWISLQKTHWAEFNYGNWGVLLEGREDIIGWAGLQFLPELNETEVGFLIDRTFWGKGFATEAAIASIRFGFDHLDLDHIIALVHLDNIASRRVIEKCEMSYRDTLPLWGMELMRFSTEGKEKYR